MTITVLQTKNHLPSFEAELARRFIVHKLHEARDPDALLDRIAANVRGIVGGPVDAQLIDRLPNLEIISRFAAGYESLDIAAARARNIKVTNTPNVLNDAVAELTIGLMIALARKIPQADRFVREGKWAVRPFGLQQELSGATLGILGLGRIGKEIARRAQAMRMRVIYFGRNRQPDEPYEFYANLAEMARDSDWLVAVAPGGRDTANIVSREVLKALGPDGFFVNVGRGSIVDQNALVDMLRDGSVGGAALDAFQKEPEVPPDLRQMDNVLLSPHQGSATVRTREKMGQLVIANLEAHFAGLPLLSPVV